MIYLKPLSIVLVFILSIGCPQTSLSQASVDETENFDWPATIPLFVGYTQRVGSNGGQELLNIPTKISSFKEYQAIFGGPPGTRDLQLTGHDNILVQPSHYLFHSLRLYFRNGGQTCYVLSVGNYSREPSFSDLQTPFVQPAILDNTFDANLIVVPDAVLLSEIDCYKLYGKVLDYCEENEVIALFDIHSGINPEVLEKDINSFRNKMPGDTRKLRYGAAYYPWLIADPISREGRQPLRESAPIVLPPTGVMAGLYVKTNQEHGPWKAPALIELEGIKSPTVAIPKEELRGFRIDATTGKSINQILQDEDLKSYAWGARSLAGNDYEWRFITLIWTHLALQQKFAEIIAEEEESILFQNNASPNYGPLKTKLETILVQLWKTGVLMGDQPEDAFKLDVATEHSNVLEGRLDINLRVNISRPIEEVKFKFQSN